MEKEWKANAGGAVAKGQCEIRKSVIRMLLDGKSGQETAKLLGVGEGRVSNVRKLYGQGGLEGLRIGRRGRKSGQKRALTAEQETELQRTLAEKAPEDFGHPENLWTQNNIQRLIAQLYGLHIKLTTLGTYLARRKFAPQRPVRRAYKQELKLRRSENSTRTGKKYGIKQEDGENKERLIKKRGGELFRQGRWKSRGDVLKRAEIKRISDDRRQFGKKARKKAGNVGQGARQSGKQFLQKKL